MDGYITTNVDRFSALSHGNCMALSLSLLVRGTVLTAAATGVRSHWAYFIG